jgi:hypothetical protein
MFVQNDEVYYDRETWFWRVTFDNSKGMAQRLCQLYHPFEQVVERKMGVLKENEKAQVSCYAGHTY